MKKLLIFALTFGIIITTISSLSGNEHKLQMVGHEDDIPIVFSYFTMKG